MCSQIAKCRIHNVNRCTIVLLSVFGFALDGLEIADGFFITAMLLWLWQREWDALEAQVMDILHESPLSLIRSLLKN